MNTCPLFGLTELHLILLCSEKLKVVKGLHTHYHCMVITSMVINALAVAVCMHGH